MTKKIIKRRETKVKETTVPVSVDVTRVQRVMVEIGRGIMPELGGLGAKEKGLLRAALEDQSKADVTFKHPDLEQIRVRVLEQIK